jgi:phosphoglycerate dehydrogenase-like enzyme
MNRNILVTYAPGEENKKIYQDILKRLAQVHYLEGTSGNTRTKLLKAAEIIIALSFSQNEIDPAEISLIRNARLIQLIYAGADNIPFEFVPDGIVLASNVGAFAKPIAEHVLALTLALAKKLIPNNRLLQTGRFDRSGFNQEIRGGICGIIGFGGNGREIAKTMRAMGMKVYGINRSGKTDVPLDFIGSVEDLQKVLAASQVVVVTLPLTRTTKDLIGTKELQWMRNDTILINVGRGDVINQQALYEHLKAHPGFRAGIDTWWSEPEGPGAFNPAFPFFELPNIIGSPHNADHVPGSLPYATARALRNVKNFLAGNAIRGVLKRADYLDV